MKDRGLECKGCSEKEDYVKMAFENQDAPKIENSTPKQPPEEEKLDKEQLDEVWAATHQSRCAVTLMSY